MPGIPQLRDRLMKTVPPVIASNGVLYLQMTSVGSHSRSGTERKKKGKKKRSGIRLHNISNINNSLGN